MESRASPSHTPLLSSPLPSTPLNCPSLRTLLCQSHRGSEWARSLSNASGLNLGVSDSITSAVRVSSHLPDSTPPQPTAASPQSFFSVVSLVPSYRHSPHHEFDDTRSTFTTSRRKQIDRWALSSLRTSPDLELRLTSYNTYNQRLRSVRKSELDINSFIAFHAASFSWEQGGQASRAPEFAHFLSMTENGPISIPNSSHPGMYRFFPQCECQSLLLADLVRPWLPEGFTAFQERVQQSEANPLRDILFALSWDLFPHRDVRFSVPLPRVFHGFMNGPPQSFTTNIPRKTLLSSFILRAFYTCNDRFLSRNTVCLAGCTDFQTRVERVIRVEEYYFDLWSNFSLKLWLTPFSPIQRRQLRTVPPPGSRSPLHSSM